ncbi:MAG: BrnT family toxin [Burkholderiales bacterium]|nr:BrnT family toxin [Burkholderiales bacterium]
MANEIVFDFEWNSAKALFNVGKHGVTLDQGATVFLDPLALTVYDATHSQDEERWLTVGLDEGGKLLVVAHTYKMTRPDNARVRLISARLATKRERQFYENEPR